MASVDIPYYLDYLPRSLIERLQANSERIDAVDGLQVANGLRDSFPSIETDEALAFVCELYESARDHLNVVLNQRAIDRDFMDQQTSAYATA